MPLAQLPLFSNILLLFGIAFCFCLSPAPDGRTVCVAADTLECMVKQYVHALAGIMVRLQQR